MIESVWSREEIGAMSEHALGVAQIAEMVMSNAVSVQGSDWEDDLFGPMYNAIDLMCAAVAWSKASSKASHLLARMATVGPVAANSNLQLFLHVEPSRHEYLHDGFVRWANSSGAVFVEGKLGEYSIHS